MSGRCSRHVRAKGFAALAPEAVKAHAAKGGRAAHVNGAAHEFTKKEAAVAGKKGGAATAARWANVRKNAENANGAPGSTTEET